MQPTSWQRAALSAASAARWHCGRACDRLGPREACVPV